MTAYFKPFVVRSLWNFETL